MKKIVFLTGTRADFGKIKSLLQILQNHTAFEANVFVTGMHLQRQYGYTLIEIEKAGFKNISTFENFTNETTMDLTLAKTIEGFSAYVKKVKPDLIVVHGDRVEALAGAIVGSLNNILVAHIEGGEISGTIDELIRHSISKLSHIHFVSNKEAENRLLQMGEISNSIFEIGSPDIDIMFSSNLPVIAEVKDYYDITFKSYAIAMFHPVTTEFEHLETYAENFVSALIESNKNYVVIYPNNDLGSSKILDAYQKLNTHKNFRILPSLRFEYFLTLLKNANFIIGNSSAGVREAPYYGVPTINIGTRQQNRVLSKTILNGNYSKTEILEQIKFVELIPNMEVKSNFGGGNSAQKFIKILSDKTLWEISHQKQFKDLN
ncbi:MAG: UDP-N-acetylglucosamine 2-epimerase [Lutibacter sp.]|uniref:UDP-N-acetylglucosamine 2-epimerase n=1 Tax=Lutibacter sp. TaxID=1925666 RepID=UPI00299CF959|nr:UDP-N-acetylglucosamine 2-epimerase [Lutibacter sp.]MDX1828181.1 UDP-N-acetylglucosamine 2-epimerase [Lutibacter sp.]